jgi:hypothetical protein
MKGFVTRINLSDSRRSENTINTYKYDTIYSSRSYYNLGLCISYIEEVWSQNYTSKDKSELVKAISLNSQNILFVLKENAIHRRSNPENASTESNPYRFGLPTDNPHRHCSKRKQFFTCTQKTTRVKLERLRSARLIQGDQKITSRHTDVLTRLKDS